MTDGEIKQLQNKRKKPIIQSKQEERKKRDRRLYEKGAVNQKILKIIEKREQTEEENIEVQEEATDTEE
ncbi:TPA: hypothetical protein TUR75_000858 [Streptococcus equi subsp. zooepidemicus]|uniref:Uncharacterized protein n=5 Tax=Streptococcus equi TaxID=1336 RepID=B4U384_STREM|nr:hypothetical protein [Streptococcus equi]KIS17469.1 hypothetical protein AT55_02055 [Streptococcus equi subsp. zooepidemicus Sz4is]ACG62451.1 hypothetical protein Sez_1099 [Streptococcus equi subsp. zooepidemicus MGCS10565]EQB23577.1 hypothetical protein M837_00996 [Streptococcus equi subsp. zooepidemicus SzS31A1]KIS06584.1 hypothetical protein AT54_00013 [Streptococcus equi subsp. zooepidemicus Sz12is]KIS07363.1 hypothetical protein N594_01508 [Streptococcus equi subsp. zooepidemicus Sz16]